MRPLPLPSWNEGLVTRARASAQQFNDFRSKFHELRTSRPSATGRRPTPTRARRRASRRGSLPLQALRSTWQAWPNLRFMVCVCKRRQGRKGSRFYPGAETRCQVPTSNVYVLGGVVAVPWPSPLATRPQKGVVVNMLKGERNVKSPQRAFRAFLQMERQGHARHLHSPRHARRCREGAQEPCRGVACFKGSDIRTQDLRGAPADGLLKNREAAESGSSSSMAPSRMRRRSPTKRTQSVTSRFQTTCPWWGRTGNGLTQRTKEQRRLLETNEMQ